MTQYNFLKVKLSILLLNKLKSGIKNGTELTIILSSGFIADSNTNFPHKLFLTNMQVPKIRNAFENGSTANSSVYLIR